MSNTEDSKSPIETLQEAASALKREANALTGFGHAKFVGQVDALYEIADSLKGIAEGLMWVGGPLKWIAAPLERTAAAMTKLTPADMSENKNALGATAGALRKAACVALHKPLAQYEVLGRLKRIEELLPVKVRGRYDLDSGRCYLTLVLQEAAEALEAGITSQLEEISSQCLQEVVVAIKKVTKDEPSA